MAPSAAARRRACAPPGVSARITCQNPLIRSSNGMALTGRRNQSHFGAPGRLPATSPPPAGTKTDGPAGTLARGRYGCRVRPNRSIPSATVVPVLVYPEVREAVRWLGAAFGFAERVQIGESHRSQLSVGEGAVIVADVRREQRPPRPGEETHSVLVRVDDARAHCERARSNGARILMEPTDFEYGERQYKAEDPAGHRWTFSETLEDVAPETWGGTLVESP